MSVSPPSTAISPVPRNAALDALPTYVFAELDALKQAARARGHRFVDLGIGSPDRPIAAPVIDALREAALDQSTHGYPPFRGVPRYLDAIGRFMERRFGVRIDPSREALALAGSKEGIAQVIAAYTGPGELVLVPEIHYPVYARASVLSGAQVHLVPMTARTGFLAEFESVPADVARRARMLIVNYPSNPTGASANLDYFERAVAFAHEHELILVSDLAYSELTFDGFVAPSALEVDGARDVTVEFHSCSKSFNMAGLRVGFAVGGASIIDGIAAYRTNVGYGTPSVVQHAAAYALDHSTELAPVSAEVYRQRRDAGVAALREIGWPVDVPRAAMYLWLRMPEGVDDWTFVRAMLDDAGVIVTPGLAFGAGGAGWFRISLVAEPEVLRDAMLRIGEACGARGWKSSVER